MEVRMKQITAAATTDDIEPWLYGLDEEGRVWVYLEKKRTWQALPMEAQK